MCFAQGHNALDAVVPVRLKLEPLGLESSTLALSHFGFFITTVHLHRSVKLALILLQQKTVKLAAIFLQQKTVKLAATVKNGKIGSNFSAAKNGQVSRKFLLAQNFLPAKIFC